MNRHVSQTLTNHNLKVTEARTALIDLVTKTDKPVDAQFLIESLQKEVSIDRVTVFRILNILTEHSILRKLEFGDGKARYELATDEHHHLICELCGAIEDVSDCNIAALESDIAKKKGFHIRRHSLEFFGFCKTCYKRT